MIISLVEKNVHVFLPIMARIFVNVQLKILIFIEKTSSNFKDGKMICVLLSNQGRIISMSELFFEFNDRSRNLFSRSLIITPFSIASSSTQSYLNFFSRDSLQVMMAHIEISMFWESIFWGKWAVHNKLDLFSSFHKTVTNFYSNRPSNFWDKVLYF